MRGLCSEFAVALKKFLNGGTISKAGLMHTYLTYQGYNCDIRGCFTKETYKFMTPNEYYRPTNRSELTHINKLLDHERVAYIVRELRKANGRLR